jgi:cytoplasmic iron level regulating protein YaaA (DUF328/UPF0246 family)
VLFLLPPSETKVDGGSGASGVDLDTLSFPGLRAERQDVLSRLAVLSEDVGASLAALKLGPRMTGEVVRNQALPTAPVMAALSRYTGVLYDPIRASGLTAPEWDWAARHLVVHSALLGLVSATDQVPAYRLSHDSRLPGRSLKATWRAPVARALAEVDDVVVDLRSEGYVSLGAPDARRSTYLRVVSDAGDRRRALNHFNKKSKGLLVRALLDDRPSLGSVGDLIAWGRERGVVLEPASGETVLVAESVLVRAA